MNTGDNSGKKLWLLSWRGIIITLLVGSNIILIRLIGVLVYKGQSLKNEIKQSKTLWMSTTQPPAVSKDHSDLLIKMEQMKKQLCVNSDSAGTEQKTWWKSQEWCGAMGARLLLLQDNEGPEFVKGLLRQQTDDTFWIGMHRDHGVWKWVNGQKSSGSLFQPPRESLQNCVLLQQSGKHYAEDCNTEHRWICQKKAVKIDFNVTFY